MTTSDSEKTPSRLSDERISALGDWRRETIDEAALKTLIRAAAALNVPRARG